MKPLLNIEIFGLIFIITALIFGGINSEAFGQGNGLASNQSLVNTNQTQLQASNLQPFTIPREDSDEISSASSSSGSTTTSSNNNVKDNKGDDMVLLSQRYNSERFADEIVGEILNNGTDTAEFVKVAASFYDSDGRIIGSESSYTDPSTINPGDRSAFTILIFNEDIEDDTERYEFTIQWQDDNSNDYSTRVTGEVGDNNGDDRNDSSDNNDDNDDGDDDN